jgi:hypothetical protein
MYCTKQVLKKYNENLAKYLGSSCIVGIVLIISLSGGASAAPKKAAPPKQNKTFQTPANTPNLAPWWGNSPPSMY